MKIINLDQGSVDWLVWRKKGIGSSDASVIYFGEHFDTTVYKLWCEKIGIGKPKKQNFAMSRGKALEPKARDIYERITNTKADPICAVHNTFEYMKASLDGWNEQHKIILEIKAPNKIDHQSALEGKIPEKYEPQLLHQLYVCGGRDNVNEIHYVSYSDYFPKTKSFALVVWKIDEEKDLEAKILADKISKFWDLVEKNIPPTDKNFIPVKTKE